MERFRKIIFRAAVNYIAAYFFIFFFVHIEPINERHKDFYMQLGLFGVPTAILLTLFGIKKEDTNAQVSARVIFTVLGSGFAFVFIGLAYFVGAWSTWDVLFEKKENPKAQIVRRGYSGGAHDSDSPRFEIFRQYNIAGLWYLYTEIDTTGIDKAEWIEVTDR